MECLPGSALPEELRKSGYDVSGSHSFSNRSEPKRQRGPLAHRSTA
jgi:hypothetical protein